MALFRVLTSIVSEVFFGRAALHRCSASWASYSMHRCGVFYVSEFLLKTSTPRYLSTAQDLSKQRKFASHHELVFLQNDMKAALVSSYARFADLIVHMQQY